MLQCSISPNNVNNHKSQKYQNTEKEKKKTMHEQKKTREKNTMKNKFINVNLCLCSHE